MNSTINVAPATPSAQRAIPGSYYEESFESGNRQAKASEIVELILREAGITDKEIRLSDDGTVIGSYESGREVVRGRDKYITLSNWEADVGDLLERVRLSTNSDWWFDRYGKFYFGPLIPNEDINAYSLKYITETSAGMLDPQYKSVRVIGDGSVTPEEGIAGGWDRSSLINYRGGYAYVDINGDDAQLAQPTFVYRNMELNTRKEIEDVRDSLLKDLQEQQAGGTVTVVGFPEIRPNDAIIMPASEEQPMGGARLGVSKVTHRLNTTDGFITKIEVKGLTPESEIVTAEEIPDLVKELNAHWNTYAAGGRAQL